MDVEPSGSNDVGRCTCCGNMTRTVWGTLYDQDDPVAAYYVRWTVGRMDHGADFDLIIGKWGKGSSAADRTVVAVRFRCTPQHGPKFMVTDAEGHRAAKQGALAASAKRRDEVIGTPLAPRVFAMLDAIWLGDRASQS